MKLLIIEDNQLLAASLRSALSNSFIVDTAYTGADGLQLATTIHYSVIVLDLGLPDMHGQTVCVQLRAQGVSTPILVATGTKDAADCVYLLDSGADDYITKPYNIDILQARIRALLRRSNLTSSEHTIAIDDLRIHLDSRRVERSGVHVHLRKKEFDILEYLAHNQGRPLTRAMILNHVWEAGKENWNNTIDVHIKYLRDKIDKPFDHPLIKTAYGVGYMIEGSK